MTPDEVYSFFSKQKKDIIDPIFWRDRLRWAKLLNRKHLSVYVTNQEHWNQIDQHQKVTIQAYLQPGYKVLDCGCAYGRAVEYMIPDVEYVGIDNNIYFIAEALRVYPKHTFIQADLTKIPYPNDSFDLAFCLSVRGMIISQVSGELWSQIEKEILRVAPKIVCVEYGEPGNLPEPLVITR